MKHFYKKLFGIALVFSIVPIIAFAHQPRVNTSLVTNVVDPEISKAYYGILSGEPHTYKITATSSFDLYVNVLVPDIPGQKKDVSAAIIKNGDSDKPIAVLEGINFEWKKFYEPFGADTYWEGPEYKARVDAGEYEIRVWSSNDDSKYSLAIGEIEAFDMKEGLYALSAIPELKKDFFNKSSIGFIRSPFGWGLILVMFTLSFVFGLIYRFILKRVASSAPRKTSKNIGKPDRLIRVILGLILFFWAITTSWSPLVLFFAGFCFFEAIFSWCGFYGALGRNTCPVE